MCGRFPRFDLRYFVAVPYGTFAHQLSDSSKISVFLTYHYTQSIRIVNKNFRTFYIRAEIFVYELCVERQIVFGAFCKMRSRHAVLILGIGDSPQQAKNKLGSTQTLLAAMKSKHFSKAVVAICRDLNMVI